MFEQSPTAGPGLGSVTDHSLEILVLLLGALLLGVLLHWLLSRGPVRQLRLLSVELARTRERLVAAERRPTASPRLRESNSTEHERTLNQLRESREAEARARERIIELEGRIATLEVERTAAQTTTHPALDDLVPALPFITTPTKPGRGP